MSSLDYSTSENNDQDMPDAEKPPAPQPPAEMLPGVFAEEMSLGNIDDEDEGDDGDEEDDEDDEDDEAEEAEDEEDEGEELSDENDMDVDDDEEGGTRRKKTAKNGAGDVGPDPIVEIMRNLTKAQHDMIQIVQHPFFGFPSSYPFSGAFRFEIPARMFPLNAKSFAQMNPEHTAGDKKTERKQTHCYARLLALWGEVVARQFRRKLNKKKPMPLPPGQPAPGFFLGDDGLPRPRLTSFIERLIVPSTNETAAFRFWICVHDSTLKIDDEFEDLLRENDAICAETDEKLKKRPNDRAVLAAISGDNKFRCVRDQATYFNQIVRKYFEHDEDFLQTRGDMMYQFESKMPLSMLKNPISPSKLFRAERGDAVPFKHVNPAQLTMENYVDLHSLSFPKGACVWRIESSEMRPSKLLKMDFPTSRAFNELLETQRQAVARSLTGAAPERTRMQDFVYDPTLAPEPMSIADKIRDKSYVRAQRPINTRQWDDLYSMHTPKTPEYYAAVQELKMQMGDRLWEALQGCQQNKTMFSPAIRAAMSFIKTSPAAGMYPEFPMFALNMNAHSTAIAYHFCTPSSVMMARDGAMNRHLAKFHILSLDATNPDDRAVSSNGLFVNKAASGKSFVFDAVMELSVPGSCVTNSKQTEASRMTDESPFEGLIIIQHEISLLELGLVEKAGENPILKTQLSEKFLTHNMCVIDEDTKKRYLRETITCARSVMLAALNESLPEGREDKHASMAPILTRFLIAVAAARYNSRESPQHAALNSFKRFNQPNAHVRIQQFRAIHAAIILYNAYVEAGVLSDPITLEADMTIMDICRRAEKAGLPAVETRMCTTIKRMIRSMTLWVAAQIAMGSEATYDARRTKVKVKEPVLDKDGNEVKDAAGHTVTREVEKDVYKCWNWLVLLEIEKLAIASKEICAYVFSLVEEEIIPFKRLKITEAMRKLVDENGGWQIMKPMNAGSRNNLNEEMFLEHFRQLSFDSFSNICETIAKQLGKDMSSQTVQEEFMKMKHFSCTYTTPEATLKIPWVRFGMNPISKRYEIAVAVPILRDGCDRRGKTLPSADWLMEQLADIWSHSCTHTSRILHVHPLKDVQSGPAMKLLGYMEVKNVKNKFRVVINEGCESIVDDIFMNNNLPSSEAEVEERNEFSVYVADEYFVSLGRRFKKLGIEPSLATRYTHDSLMRRVFETRANHPKVFEHAVIFGRYPEDVVGLVLPAMNNDAANLWIKDNTKGLTTFCEHVARLSEVGMGGTEDNKYLADRQASYLDEPRETEFAENIQYITLEKKKLTDKMTAGDLSPTNAGMPLPHSIDSKRLCMLKCAERVVDFNRFADEAAKQQKAESINNMED